MEVEFGNGEEEDSLLYESVLEEIALEGLDGITIQGLLERLVDREGAPIVRRENHKVIASIWNSVKRDLRFSFYILPHKRPDLLILNRNNHLDEKGKFYEPDWWPDDIYNYKCIELLEEEVEKRAPVTSLLEGSSTLSPTEINRIKFNPKTPKTPTASKKSTSASNTDEVVLEGLRFFTNTVQNVKKEATRIPPKTKKKTSAPATTAISPPKSPKNKSAKSPRSKSVKTPKSKSKTKSKDDSSYFIIADQEEEEEGEDEGDGGEEEEGSEKKKSKTPSGGGGCGGEENLVGLRGSCPDFEERRNISQLLRRRNLSFFKAFKMFGNRLVIVASQQMRESLLLSSMNQVRLSSVKYCVVERVGRGRHYGEQARGKVSLVTMKIDPKVQFYIRKGLLADGVISKQPLIMRYPGQRVGTLISVFHLPHFFRRVESASSVNVRKVFAYICGSPIKMCEYSKLQNVFGKHLMRALVEEYQELVQTSEVSYMTLHPGEYEMLTSVKSQAQMLKRKVRVIGLRDPEIGIRQIILKQLTKQQTQNQQKEEDEGEELQQQDDCDGIFDWRFCYCNEKESPHEFELTKLLRLVISRGNKGITKQEVSRMMNITQLDARSACRYLGRWKFVKNIWESLPNTKVNRLLYWKCEGPAKKVKPVKSTENAKYAPKKYRKELPEVELSDPLEMEMDILGSLTLPQPEIIKIEPPKKQKSPSLPLKNAPSPVKGMGEIASEIFPESSSSSPPIKVKKAIKRRKSRAKKATEDDENEGGKRRRVDSDFRPQKRKGFLLPPRLVSPSELPYFPRVLSSNEGRRIRKRFFDDADEFALERLEKQRNEWSEAEDFGLLLLFATSVAFIPRYNLEKILMYNPHQLRDVFHAHFPESRSKTTYSMRRRLHFLMKDPGVKSKYNFILAKALWDEELYNSLVAPHIPPPSINIFHRVPLEVFSAAFLYLKDKFDKDPEGGIEIEKEMKLEDLMDQRELKRMEGVWVDVWASVFKMFRNKDKEPKEPQVETELVSEELEREGLELIEDCEPRWYKPLPHIPFVPGEDIESKYQDEELEFVFEVATSLFRDLGRFLREKENDELPKEDSTDDEELEEDDGKEKKTKIVMVAHGMKPKDADLCSCLRDARSTTDVSEWTARTATLSILTGGHNDEDFSALITFMSSIPDTVLEQTINSFRDLGMLCVLKQPRRTFALTANVKRKLLSWSLQPSAFRIAFTLLSDLEEPGNENVRVSDFDHLGSAYTLMEIIPYVNLEPLLPSTVITVNEEWREDYEIILNSSPQALANREESALRLMRFKLNADNIQGRFVEKDFFDINLPQLLLSRKEGVEVSGVIEAANSPQMPLDPQAYLENKLVQLVSVDGSEEMRIEEMVLGRFINVYKTIALTDEIGVSLEFLKKHFEKKFIGDALSYLLSCNYIYLVGIKSRRFVAAPHIEKWTVLIQGDHSKRLVSRPWLDTKGDVNWRLVDRAFVSIIGVLQRAPFTPVAFLTARLAPLFSHVEVLLLLSALVHFNIIAIFKFPFTDPTKQKKFDMFAKWTPLLEDEDIDATFKDYNVNELLEFDEVCVEPLPFHISKYCQLQQKMLPMGRADMSQLGEDFLQPHPDEDGEYSSMSFDPEETEVYDEEYLDEDEEEFEEEEEDDY